MPKSSRRRVSESQLLQVAASLPIGLTQPGITGTWSYVLHTAYV